AMRDTGEENTAPSADGSRGRVMQAWGGPAGDRDDRWNTDPVIAGLFTYAMAAFARRVADHPAFFSKISSKIVRRFRTHAIRFITATMETYDAFRPELPPRRRRPGSVLRHPIGVRESTM